MDRIRQLIGIFTLVAAVGIGMWFFRMLSDDDNSGLFEVRLEFRDVRGLKTGADVRYRGVRVGTVSDVGIGLDGEKGVITILLEPDGSRLTRQSSRFWIVVPRFGGITGGATGLDTLVRDAYIAFITTESNSPELAAGSLLAGLERPPIDRAVTELDPIRRGDLLMTLLVVENSGIHTGADVQFRGMTVGEVRNVELAGSGTHIEMQLRIRARYRATVTDRSQFWIARPRVSGALLRGISLEDVSAIISPFVGYHAESDRGVPVPDGYRVVAEVDRPNTSDSEVPEAAREQSSPGEGVVREGGLRVVEIVYECTEEDWLSPDDEEQRRGSGLLFVDPQGRTVALTVRSLCDGSSFMTDTLGSPEIKREAIRVVVPGVGVYRAGRTWVDPGGGELALIVLEDVPPDLVTTLARDIDFEADPEVADEFATASTEHPSVLGAKPPALGVGRGAVLVREGRAVGLLGRSAADADLPGRIALIALPVELRPKP